MWSDKETHQDCLGYSTYVQVLANVCTLKDLAPLTLGIFGPWGSGKTSLMEMLRRRLGFTDPDPERDKDKENHIGNVRYGNEPRLLWGACPGMSHAEVIVEAISWVDWPK